MRALRQLALDVRQRATLYGPAAVEELSSASPDLLEDLSSCWQMHARANQMRPKGCEDIWLVSAGRGMGKTRLAAEEVLDVCEDWGGRARILIASKTIGDVRKVMIGGQSGLEACAMRRGYQMHYISSHSMIYHPSGSIIYLVTAEKPDMSRGLECNYFWLDEISSWKNPIESFDNIFLSWRLPCPGKKKGIITTTPKPNPIMARLVKEMQDTVTVTYGSTRDNRENLAKGTVEQLEALYQGTRLGRQELDGELLDSAGSMVSQDIIHMHRMKEGPVEYVRKIVSLDPSITDNENSDAAGIVVVGRDNQAIPDAYVIADRTIEMATFSAWAQATVDAFLEFDCDCVVAEVNQGGGGIVEAIKTEADRVSKLVGYEVVVPVKPIWARQSKRARAEPIGALYERGRVHHVGHFPEIEKELTSWMPGFGMDSPNRLDALVHGVAHLLLGEREIGPLSAYLKGGR